MAIPFQAFDEYGDVRIYRHGDLPHWRQDGCTYFVTFRLADALPASVVDALREERERVLRAMGIDPEEATWRDKVAELPRKRRRAYERLVAASSERALDRGYGACVLRAPRCWEIVSRALAYYHGERVWTGDHVVMPNHVHALLTPMPPIDLESVLRSIKGFSARAINRALGRRGTLWQRDSYDHIVRDAEQLERFQIYIRNNPAKAGLNPGEYGYASANYQLQ